MDLTNEPWEVLEPLISNPVRRADGRGIPWEVPVGSSLVLIRELPRPRATGMYRHPAWVLVR
jgi:hypothetical protein